jgi:8-oxo-dGTP pyrophosphatase MutT (NUDIX family)
MRIDARPPSGQCKGGTYNCQPRTTILLTPPCDKVGCRRRIPGHTIGDMADGDDFEERYAQLSRAIRDALAAVQAITDNDGAYRAASRLVDTLGAATTASGRLRAQAARRMRDAEDLSFAQLGQRLGVSRARAADMLRITEARQPEPPPVAVAIVTSERGVLAGRRNDQTPPWTFIAGQVDAGESPADAAVREVREETGLDVTAGRVLARRVHPATSRTMIYLAARPVDQQQPDVYVADEADLAEVRWLSLDEADKLLTGMYPPVRAYLSRALRPTHPAG